MRFRIEFEREQDGRWIAEVPELCGVMCYGGTRDEAAAHVKALALHVVADRIQAEQTLVNCVEFVVRS